MRTGLRSRLWPLERRLRIRGRRLRRWTIRAGLDFGEWRDGERDPLIARHRKNLPSGLPALGERLVTLMIEMGGLQPGDAVLDIGCGPGRTAAPLTRYLDPAAGGRYEGFDVMPRSIRWCRRRITTLHPSFRFQLADLHNAQYNPRGSQRAADYVFPYDDKGFDIALAASLFTHLQPFEAERYLEQTARTLRPGGRLIGSWYLLNDEAERLLDAGRALRPGLFKGDRPPLRLDHELTDERGNRFRAPEARIPEHLIAVCEDDVRVRHERAGLRVLGVLHGSWCGREAEPGGVGQDVVVAERA